MKSVLLEEWEKKNFTKKKNDSLEKVTNNYTSGVHNLMSDKHKSQIDIKSIERTIEKSRKGNREISKERNRG